MTRSLRRSLDPFTIVAQMDLSQHFVTQYPVNLVAGATFHQGNLFIARHVHRHHHHHHQHHQRHQHSTSHSLSALTIINNNRTGSLGGQTLAQIVDVRVFSTHFHSLYGTNNTPD